MAALPSPEGRRVRGWLSAAFRFAGRDLSRPEWQEAFADREYVDTS